MQSWPEYSLRAAISKALLLILWWPGLLAAGISLDMQSGPGQLAGLSWASLTLEYQDQALEGSALRLAIDRLQWDSTAASLDLALVCAPFHWGEFGPECEAAEVLLSMDKIGTLRLAGIEILSDPSRRLVLRWQSGPARAELRWGGDPAAPAFQFSLEQLDLARLPPVLLAGLGLDVLAGRLSAGLSFGEGRLGFAADWHDGRLDGLGGLLAAEALYLSIQGWMDGPGPEAVSHFSVRQLAGEILMGSIYLPPPAAALGLELTIRTMFEADGLYRLDLDRFSISDPESISAQGRAALLRSDQGWRFEMLEIEQMQLSLPQFWARWMEGPAAALGFSALQLGGHVEGGLLWHAGLLQAAQLSILAVDLVDPRGRLGLQGLQARIDGQDASLQSEWAWESASLWGLPLGLARAQFQLDAMGARLLEPIRLPFLDGMIGIDSLVWSRLPPRASQIILDARIEPVSLSLLGRELGLIELGGTLAGRFPGVQYQDEQLLFTGGIVIDAFAGQIFVDDLLVERPFGSLPALAAQVEFQRLDLLDLTSAFDFGRMDGQLSGWMRDLRLLDWRLVAMDARVLTHDDAPRRRISQRAVDNLSRLGGGGGALRSATILGLFDDFPYRRAGLACRLSNNICYLDGVAPHPSGGFLIVEGRGLPRLDVVGHRRLVDWPQLMLQLQALGGDDGP